MEFEDDAFILSARPFGETGAIVEALTQRHGKYAAHAPGEGPPALFDDRLALAGLSAAAAVAAGALPEREPHPGAFLGLEAFMDALAAPEIWPAVYVRFEAGLLADLGFGLDLSRCAVTGSPDDLIYVSPRTGRAVSATAGADY